LDLAEAERQYGSFPLASKKTESHSTVRAASLFLVLVIARLLSLRGAPLPASIWTPVGYLWQDLATSLAFALVDYVVRREWFGWAAYALAAAYAALNVGITRVLFSPLTLPMIRAAGGPLADSIKSYLTLTNAGAIGLTVAASFGFPLLLAAKVRRGASFPAYLVAACLALTAAGPYAISKVDTAGRYRNAFGALWPLHLARANDIPKDRDWRTSPFPQKPDSTNDLSVYRGAAAGRNLVLILLESTGAEYWPAPSAAVDPMPNLTALSRHSILFQNAYAVYPESIKGLLSVLCSRYPAFNVPADAYASVKCPSLAQQLADRGYRTALFHSGRFMYLGMPAVVENRGFEVLEDAGAIGGNVHSSFGIDDRLTVHRALEWIDSLKPGEPFFVTYLPVAGHHPYVAPVRGPFAPSGANEDLTRYLNALHYGDQALGVLLDGLRARNLDEKTLFVVFGDHGEAFGRHAGNFGHTQFIYEENVHVPYLIAAPGLFREQMRIRSAASLIDTAPTIMDLLGVPSAAGFQGTSMLDPRPRMSLFFTDYSLGWLGLYDNCYKYLFEVDSERQSLFDVCKDREETLNVSGHDAARASAYRSIVKDWIASTAP
jgi:phosphoglycerol transferase MdoB-like AlkP superfamily enzyme